MRVNGGFAHYRACGFRGGHSHPRWGHRSAAVSPGRLPATVRELEDAQDHTEAPADAGSKAAKEEIADCDASLRQHRAALEAGASPEIVTGWINETRAKRAAAEARLRQRPAGRRRMTREEIANIPEPARPGTRSPTSWTCSPWAPSPAPQARSGKPPSSPRPSETCSPSSRSRTRRRSSRRHRQAPDQQQHHRLVTRPATTPACVRAGQTTDPGTIPDSHLRNSGEHVLLIGRELPWSPTPSGTYRAHSSGGGWPSGSYLRKSPADPALGPLLVRGDERSLRPDPCVFRLRPERAELKLPKQD